MAELDTIRDDLGAECDALDSIVSELDPDQWSTPTPSPGWTIADQIGHLAAVDWKGALAIADPEAFAADARAVIEQVMEAGSDSFMLEEPRAMSPDDLLEWWRDGRRALIGESMNLEGDSRLPWYGPSMSAKSFLTARLMETWAHGQDVVDALNVGRDATPRLRHIAHLGVITRSFAYANRGLDMPDGEVRVELSGAGGTISIWGEGASENMISGPIEDFCLVVTQRRNVADTRLELVGDLAMDWMAKAQAFAGPPTNGPDAEGQG